MVVLDDYIYISAVEVLNRSRAEGRSVYDPLVVSLDVPCSIIELTTNQSHLFQRVSLLLTAPLRLVCQDHWQ